MTKVISLSNKAYQTLSSIKGAGESFSDVVLRIAEKSGDILSLFGCAKEDHTFISGLKKAHKEREFQELRVY